MKQKFLRASEKIRVILLDLLFPIECLGCGGHGQFLCDPCQASLARPHSQQCPRCEKISTRGMTCLDCLGKTSLDGVFVALRYRKPLTRTAIHTLKYRFIRGCAPALAQSLITELHNAELPLPQLIVPVPLHSRRLRWRGFNQSELIAQHLAQELTPGLPIPVDTTSLQRVRHTPPQARLPSKDERFQNLQGAFAWRSQTPLAGKTIWLVDDVATTLATLEACAQVLKKAGATTVIGIVLAR